MKERGLPFSAWSIPRLQDGSKTQTRRVMKVQPTFKSPYWKVCPQKPTCLASTDPKPCSEYQTNDMGLLYAAMNRLPCPYGVPGGIIYAREALVRLPKTGDNAGAFYAVDHEPVMVGREPMAWRWKRPYLSPRFMPKEAARIRRELADVRAQQVQDISEEGAKAEGCETFFWGGYEFDCSDCVPVIANFHRVWDSINAKRGFGWDVNPWVWPLTFRRIEEQS